MIDYSIFYRRSISVNRIHKELPAFDVFLSAYNSSDRVSRVFRDVVAGQKYWVLHPEYCYAPLDEPIGDPIIRPLDLDEVAQVNNIIDSLGGSAGLGGVSLCIDITGLMRHVLAFLLSY